MELSLSLMAGFNAGSEQPDLPVEEALPIDNLAALIYVPQAPEFELAPPLPQPQLQGEEPASEDEDVVEAVVDSQVDPQQWLVLMLNQQSVQLEARDYVSGLPQSTSSVLSLAGLSVESEKLPSDEPLPSTTDTLVAYEPNVRGEERLAKLLGTLAPVVPTQAFTALAPTPAPALAAGPALGSDPAPASCVAVSDGVPASALGAAVSQDGSEVGMTAAALPASPSSPAPVLERGLKLAAPEARWGEQMLHALRETVEVQVQQRFQQATIRLDPPELGSLEILISHESGRLSVHISAAQTDVARLLVNTSERLRQELVQHNALDVQVQISSNSQGHSSHQQARQPHEPAIAQAVEEAQTPDLSQAGRSSDVLVTV
ncbi:flagellar hook-length control protein FliK [Pseudomonas chlororaphis subsp. aurantiaca]|uniref:flagellar hook-length control protein FliK n=1 Tax=Pseudomonas chlororaphis TaxID=587753 RepID=UPI0027DC23B6|nr:flagellar hook-length control protein FliK [Pseudomonas chlororaphis]WMI97614.1 flagellar hook-length control protein FliK [Pseudomonas chlororaphis subsp. aurantiaca]